MSGQTADISSICEFEWFQWVMFYQPTEKYIKAKPTIGRYLGPATDVGTAMTHKILLPTGNYVCRDTVRSWTMKEEENVALLDLRKQFMTQVVDNLGSECVVEDFDPNDVTPDFDYYEDDDVDGFEGTPDEILPPTPEAGDNYVGARLRLPCSDREAMGRVAKHARIMMVTPLVGLTKIPSLTLGSILLNLRMAHRLNSLQM